MSVIKLLDKHVAELIAAGEVVERPASVIKELVENSIDALATSITVEIKNGGVTYMRVTDNGKGIYHDDVRTAFLRHATSKVSTSDDLDSILTLGFRGEALASICAVSKVDILTKPADEEFGTSYSINGGVEECYDYAGCPDGTTIVVRDLFYNTPARMKFLKKDVTEGIAVSGILDKIAMSRPDISFRFIRDGQEVFFTSGDGNWLSCIRAVCGRDFADEMLEVDYTYENFKVKGYISKPIAARKNRSKQFFFINNRFVKSLTAMSALEEAYKNSIMVGKFPSAVLNIEMPASFVDVNVHPSKTEVRFSNEKPVFYSVYYAVKSALEEKDRLFEQKNTSSYKSLYAVDDAGEQLNFGKTEEVKNNNHSQKFENVSAASFKNNGVKFETSVVSSDNNVFYKNLSLESPKNRFNSSIGNTKRFENAVEKITVFEPVTKDEVKKVESISEFDYKIIGEIFNTYIICQVDNDVVFLDKHAAHERIIFNSLKKDGSSSHQILLVPVTVTLSKEEYAVILNNIDTLDKCGFEVEDFGIGKILVRAVPSYLNADEIEDSIAEIADHIMQNKKEIITDKLDWIYHSVSCRAAVKGGNHTGYQDNENLVKTVFENGDILYCPHGRPVIYKLSRKELERRFGRIQ